MSEAKPKFSLTAQIAEVKRELSQRKSVYGSRVAAHKMRAGVADLQMDIMSAVLATLEWMQANERDIRGYVSALNAAPELRSKIPLVLFFGTAADRDELIAAFKQAKPNVNMIKIRSYE